ncbi:prion-like-(Q/N-rich) domain-bearing protein 25 isoform X2 [Anoplophora glabripennis]|uniref:prion-like-(Q/N-rich) domain-bearing protein 25 isoform X2 n=1 Tax=Anoplophora glabripennis TaxID=217634 RepID=UPI000875408F|nr:prion-like-(Q/N-rich) domain-bearing protein 25 isoform X2 [Anoplophora glabripennis]
MNCLVFSMVLLIFKSTLALEEECTKNSDCTTTNSVCIGNKCTCDDLSYHSASRCLPYATEYSASCYENEQCDWLGDNSECIHNRCVCSENFKWYKGKCRKYADKGEACDAYDACYNGYDMLSLTCSKGVCVCSSEEYYDRGYDCRKSSKERGDCALTLDCQSPTLGCTRGKCTSTNSSSEQHFGILNQQFQPVQGLIYGKGAISCETDGDCVDMANSLCDISNKTCKCNENTHYLYNGNCVQGLSHCDDASDCTDISNAICYKHSCVCQQGFFSNAKECVAELGMQDPHNNYTADSDCPIKPGQLVNSACYCKDYWFNDASNRNCIKSMSEPARSCVVNEWCTAMGPYSYCDSASNTCQCSSGATFNEETYYCEPKTNNTVDCLRDTECDINERCVDEKCECSENFSRGNDTTCVPNIGASCASATSCSHMKNAHCVGGACRCGNDYVGKETKCLKIADSLEDSCEEEEQCQGLAHAVCGVSEIEYVTNEYNDTLRCICEEGYTEVNDMCHQVKKYGDPCMTESQCTLVLNRSYKCRNSMCQCNVGQSLKNGYCTSASNVAVASSLLFLSILLKLGLS